MVAPLTMNRPPQQRRHWPAMGMAVLTEEPAPTVVACRAAAVLSNSRQISRSLATATVAPQTSLAACRWPVVATIALSISPRMSKWLAAEAIVRLMHEPTTGAPITLACGNNDGC